jgi:hypothetical protein
MELINRASNAELERKLQNERTKVHEDVRKKNTDMRSEIEETTPFIPSSVISTTKSSSFTSSSLTSQLSEALDLACGIDQ